MAYCDKVSVSKTRLISPESETYLGATRPVDVIKETLSPNYLAF